MLFERLEKRQEVVNLVGREHKLRHGRVSGDDTLSERLLESFDRVVEMQGPERRRRLEWTCARPPDGMAPGAMRLRIGLAALLRRRCCQRRRHHQYQRDNRLSQ